MAPRRAIYAQMMLGAFLCLAFVLPPMIAAAFWPTDSGDGIMKIAAILTGALLFVAMKSFYMFCSLKLTQLEMEKSR